MSSFKKILDLFNNSNSENVTEQPEVEPTNNLEKLKYSVVLIENPKNQLAEILHEMLVTGQITRKSAMNLGVLNLTSRIANLRIHHNIDVVCVETPTKNKFGRPVAYGVWHVRDKDYAFDKYVNKINK